MVAEGEVSEPTPISADNSLSRELGQWKSRPERPMVLQQDIQENTSGDTPKKPANSTPEDGGIHGLSGGFQIWGLTRGQLQDWSIK